MGWILFLLLGQAIVCPALALAYGNARPYWNPPYQSFERARGSQGFSSQASSVQTPYMLAVLSGINQFRTQNGLRAVRLETRLISAAQQQSDFMATTRRMSHVGRNGWDVARRTSEVGYDWSAVAENVAWGQQSPEEVVQDWIESPGHRANLLNPTVQDIGIGYAQTYWTVILARPLNHTSQRV